MGGSDGGVVPKVAGSGGSPVGGTIGVVGKGGKAAPSLLGSGCSGCVEGVVVGTVWTGGAGTRRRGRARKIYGRAFYSDKKRPL